MDNHSRNRSVQDNQDTLIFQNPDGTYLELEPFRETDEVEEKNFSEQGDEMNIEIIDQQIPSLVESILDMLMKQQCNILCIVIMHFILNLIFTSMNLYFRLDILSKLKLMFNDDIEKAENLYYFLQSLDFLCSFFFYFLAISAYCNKSVRAYKILMRYIYLCFFIQVLLAYINKQFYEKVKKDFLFINFYRLNLLLIFLKVLTYVYANFIGSLIKELVTIHQD